MFPASRTLTLAALLALAGAANAQTTWHRQSSLPARVSLGGIWFTSPTHGFIAGGDLNLHETRDGGRTWITHSSEDYGGDPFYRVAFSPDGLKGIVVGNNMSARRTADGGATWQPSPGPNFGSWYALDWIDNATCFAAANGAFAITPDAGLTWETRSAYPDCPITYGMDFRDADVGLIAGHRATDDLTGIFKTIDGGRTWRAVFDLGCNDVLWVDDSRVIATVGQDIYESRDAGESWNWLSTGIDTGLSELVNVAPGIFAGVSGVGDVWLSQDGGLFWFRTLEGLGTLPASWDINFSDPDNGWIAGDAGMIFRSTDGGLNWRIVSRGIASEIADIQMLDDDTGLAVAGAGYLLRTDNGGQFWSTSRLKVTGVVFGRNEGLETIAIRDRDNMIVSGQGGLAFRTWDGGETWLNIGYPFSLPGSFDIHAIAFVDADHLFAAGSHGSSDSIYESFDGGFTWLPRADLPPAYWVDAEFIDPLNGWLLTGGNVIWRTTNGGLTWSSRVLPTPHYSAAMDFVSPTTGWAVGWWGFCARTTNGGLSWVAQNIGGTDFTALDVRAVSATEAWAVGVQNLGPAQIWHTVNGGTTWVRTPKPDASADSLSSVAALPSGAVWLGGFGGDIFHNRDRSACPADLSGSSDPNDSAYGTPDGNADASDFFYFLDQFAAGSLAVADLSGSSDPNDPAYGTPNGTLDASDFFYYLDIFVTGCP